MIELAGVTKRYGEKVVVDDLTFTVRPGSVTGFLGPNGAGKSTTMRMMLGLDRPTSAMSRIDGKRYAELKDPLQHIGALLDAKAMHGGRSAYQTTCCAWRRATASRTRGCDEVLEQVGLERGGDEAAQGLLARHGPAARHRRARCSATREILMFDEPVNGLDPEGILWIRTLMKRWRPRAVRSSSPAT